VSPVPTDIVAAIPTGYFGLGDARDARGPHDKPDACCRCGRRRVDLTTEPPQWVFRYAVPL
jgi:hypothetical protein